MIDKHVAIIDIEGDYKFLEKFLINKLLIPRGEETWMIPEEVSAIQKEYRVVEVKL